MDEFQKKKFKHFLFFFDSFFYQKKEKGNFFALLFFQEKITKNLMERICWDIVGTK